MVRSTCRRICSLPLLMALPITVAVRGVCQMLTLAKSSARKCSSGFSPHRAMTIQAVLGMTAW